MKRSRSLPPQAVNKINQKCYFYHSKGSCRWGNYCRYVHKIKYVPKISPFKPSNSPVIIPKAESPLPLYKMKVQKIRDDLRKQEIEEHFSTIRNLLLDESKIESLPPQPEPKKE